MTSEILFHQFTVKGRYVFSWVWGEGWGIRNVFPKLVLALPCILIKKLLTPHVKVTDKSATFPSLLQGMFHVVETSENFACRRKMFEYKVYLDIDGVRAETRKCEQLMRCIYVLWPRAQINRCFKGVSSEQGIERQSKSFLKNTLFQKSLWQIIFSI